MNIYTAAEILQELKLARPRPTREAPNDARGIYGLFDHDGAFRYIGSTTSENETFYKRIHQRHRAGSETSSHYFSRMYNTGRMWRLRNDPATKSDGDIAKRLRNAFIDRHCCAVWVPLPDSAPIAALEAEVIALAPADMIAWNRRGMNAYEEPTELVDALIESLGLSAHECSALDRQRDRYARAGEISLVHTAAPLSELPDGPFRFFALDVETANNDRSSICQVGVACVRPDDGIEIWVTFVDPQTDKWIFTSLHGIGAAKVEGAPTIGKVIDMLDKRLAGQPVYQHSSFDRTAIRAACDTLHRAEPLWDWKDSVQVARAAWPELTGNGGHGLASLKDFLGLKFKHHDAGEDARASAEVVLHAEKGDRPEYFDDVLDNGDTVPLPRAPVPLPTQSLNNVVGRSRLSQGNIDNFHFSLTSFIFAFPSEVIGGKNRHNQASQTVSISWGGATPAVTDIDGAKKIFRGRSWVKRFYEINVPGRVIA